MENIIKSQRIEVTPELAIDIRILEDHTVISSARQTRLQVYECQSAEEAVITYNTIRDTLRDVYYLLAK